MSKKEIQALNSRYSIWKHGRHKTFPSFQQPMNVCSLKWVYFCRIHERNQFPNEEFGEGVEVFHEDPWSDGWWYDVCGAGPPPQFAGPDLPVPGPVDQ